MADLKLKYIVEFLHSRGWQQDNDGKRFVSYKPPLLLDLPSGFRIEIPREDHDTVGMKIYIDGLLNILKELYESYKQEDFSVLFSNSDTIFSTRVMDEDTKDGTIQLSKLSKIYELEMKILKQAVSFMVTHKSVFGNAKEEADTFIENSRSLPTARGSFVTKIQLPNYQNDYSRLVIPPGEKVVNKVFTTIDYIQNEVVDIPIEAISKDYIKSNEKLINIELLSSINNFYKNTQINNVEFTYYNNYNEGSIHSQGLLSKANHISNFIRRSKSIIIQETPLTFIGKITRLNSVDPSSDKDNSVIIEIDSPEEIRSVRTYLTSRQYKMALEAHSKKSVVLLEGIAKPGANQYIVNYPEKFEIIETGNGE